MTATRTALVTGATGYVGSRLVPHLLEIGWHVKVLARRPERLTVHAWGDQVDVVPGDAADPDTLRRALADVDVAYYLLHSMDGGGDLSRRDHDLATTFASVAHERSVGRIVYLGGLHPSGRLSEHLASRTDVGEVFLASPVPAAVLQAGILIGTGSASFEMLRHLTHRLPVMVTPRWVTSRIQPIAIADALHYLAAAGTLPADVDRAFDIGGPDVLTYEQMIQRYVAVAGLRPRRIVVVPVLTPALASRWVGLVTPVPSGIARPLVDSLVHDAVCDEHDLTDLVGAPAEGATSYDDAVRRALDGSRDGPESIDPGDPSWAGPR
ncbi:NAD(P)H-binding protein [Luteipulveratus halotolerans]|uniref:Oxidoreductase n=1 Tax=Luteipulveratus halotolerans TaxID=1631356 RepID=A0A0L6CGW0_9MICO|nr:NAD(P)H-binding protein [Luteipulveratus halotolerans]KNX36845.1 oxidoreductase [Luteipulveratus halotolerans]